MNKEINAFVDLMFNTNIEEIMNETSTLEYIHKLQQIINKAIEYGELIDNRDTYLEVSELRHLLKILKGKE